MTEYDLILSFTSWRKRLKDRKLLYVIQHALQQKTQYKYKLVLVLSEDEFKNKEGDVPKDILELTKLLPDRFEILWTKRDTRALKKLNPSMKKWPDLPIMTFDDDMILLDTAVDVMMNEYKKTPDTIVALSRHPLKRGNRSYDKLIITSHVKIFPPNSLYDLDEDIFMKVFRGLEDDIFNGIRAAISGTKARGIPKNGVISNYFPVLYAKTTALNSEYRFFDARQMVANFCNEYKEYAKYIM